MLKINTINEVTLEDVQKLFKNNFEDLSRQYYFEHYELLKKRQDNQNLIEYLQGKINHCPMRDKLLTQEDLNIIKAKQDVYREILEKIMIAEDGARMQD